MKTPQKIAATILALACIAMGVAVAIGEMDFEDSGSGSRRSRGFRRLFGALNETLGPIPTGLILVALGGVFLYFAWKPAPETPLEASRRRRGVK